MRKYPLCEEVGLKITELVVFGGDAQVILASEVEALLQKGVRVYGTKDREAGYAHTGNSHGFFTHSGFLIDYKEIKPKKVTRDEIKRALDNVSVGSDLYKLLKRIEKEGVE